MADIKVTIKGNLKHAPDGNFNDLALRVKAKAPVIEFRTAQALHTTMRLTAPQPPRQAWWYPKNPKTKKVVPPPEWYVRTGELKASIVKVKGPEGWQVAVLAPYAKFVEHGTRFMPPQHFFADSIKHVRHEVLPEAVKRWLKK